MSITFRGTASSQVACGNNLVSQSIFLIENGVLSRVNVIIKRLSIQNDSVVALTAVASQVKSFLVDVDSSPVLGVPLAKGKFDTSLTSDPNIKFWCHSLHSPLVIGDGTLVWQQVTTRLHTAVGQVRAEDGNMLSTVVGNEADDFILTPGHGLLVQVVSAAATSNASGTNNWLAQCVWEEDSLATFNISGVVTLSAVPVVGAKVIIIEADDESLTNAVLLEVKTTTEGGVWSSSIRSGKVGAAFVQYESGGTYYTAPGSPFLEA